MKGKAKDGFSGENIEIKKSLHEAGIEMRTLRTSIPAYPAACAGWFTTTVFCWSMQMRVCLH